MLPQFGFGEIIVIALLALIVVGPAELPVMARKAGQFFGKMKAMGQEFKDAFTQMGEDEELAQLRKEIDDLKSMGKLSNLSDEAFAEDMRDLEREIQDGTQLDVPKPKTPKPTKTKGGESDAG